MCGVAAISSSSGNYSDVFPNILRAISHRGPDDSGIYSSQRNDVYLGHVRLSILDLSASGHQPMSDISGRYIMIYNGEVYNFKELKNELERKHGLIRWKSSSDSEVIIEGFAREGVGFLDKLNGIFAVLIYDKQESTLYVLRDPIGIKPLYITEQNGSVFICSELKGLLSLPSLNRTIRQQSLADQLTYMYVPEPYTMYNEFFKVSPGVLYIYKEGLKVSECKMFNHLNDEIRFANEGEIREQFELTLSEAVRRQLISDVPISMMLSGGLDSSVIAYEALNNKAKVHSAYTISYSKDDQQFDGQSSDLYYAEKVSKHLNIDLRVIEAKSDFMHLLPDLVPFLEDGISDPAAINTYLICKSAREDGIKVMLSGQGADEYLCGYRRYIAERHIENMPSILKKSFSLLGELLPAQVNGRLNAPIRRLKKFSLAATQDRVIRLSQYFMWSTPAIISELFLDPLSVSPGLDITNFFKQRDKVPFPSILLQADQQFDLLALNLAYSDKMSMAVGLEARVPFLDFDLVRLMNALPDDMKIRNNTQKFILKESMKGKLPDEVIYRQKAGFALPIRSWFRARNEFFDYYFDYTRILKQGIFNAATIDKLYMEQISGKKDHSYLLFAILCQQVWLEKNY